MLQSVKRFFVFQGKALEFKYRTWESRRAIRRAYREGGVSSRLFSAVRAHRRAALLVLVSMAVIAALLTAGPMAVGYLTHAYTAARAAAAEHRTAQEARKAAEQKARAERVAVEKKKEEAAKQAALAQLAVEKAAAPPVATPPVTTPPAAASEDLRRRYCVLANKATKSVFLLSTTDREKAWKIVEQFPAVMGRNEGQKQAAGDRRTPEGIYFIIGRKEKAELNQMYGPMAYVLNYPNEEDRKAGRTGQGIWIHGMPEDSSRMVTRGCIVMQNTWLIALEHYLKLGVGTPVVIVDKPDLSEPEKYPDYTQIEEKRTTILRDYANQEENFRAILSEWKNAWASRDINAYSQFYDAQRFFSSGMSWNAWRERKKNIFQSFDNIEISVDNIRLVDCSESTAVVVFRQLYEATPQAAKQNAKRLCFYRNGSRWLIYREETFSTEEFLL
jgi:murein L,D-transpeptidase YafK